MFTGNLNKLWLPVADMEPRLVKFSVHIWKIQQNWNSSRYFVFILPKTKCWTLLMLRTSEQTWKKPFFCELWNSGTEIWRKKKHVNYNKFKIATQQCESNTYPNTFFFLPKDRCYMILQCYLHSITNHAKFTGFQDDFFCCYF